MKPIIGITVDCQQNLGDPRSGGQLRLNWNYTQAISDAGGVPILIPPTADMEAVAEIIDGWLIPGGDDIDAMHFGEENHPEVKLSDPSRFDAESRLFHAVETDLPVFGICYGCQFVNVVQGGSLIQHLPDVVGHSQDTGGTMQRYQIDASSKLANTVQDVSIDGKSYHHQAVSRVADGMVATARNEDGTVEALESTQRPWLVGVQWHPERTLEDPKTRRIFESFVAAAREYHANRKRMAVRP